MKEHRKQCFVLMPSDDQYQALFELIRSRMAPRKVDCSRDETSPRTGLITEIVFDSILGADLIIADVSGPNPNVMYELGFVHTLKKPTVHLIQKNFIENKQIPFYLTDVPLVTYNPEVLADSHEIDLLANKIWDQFNKLNLFDEVKTQNLASNAISNVMGKKDYKLFRWENKWLWGYEKTYNEEKKAKALFAVCHEPQFEEMDPLYKKLIRDRARHGIKSYMMLPDTVPNGTSKQFIMSLVEGVCKYPDECCKILLVKEMDPFLFMGHGFFIYDPYSDEERAYMMEPMASDIMLDTADVNICENIEKGKSCAMANLKEHTFDIEIQDPGTVRRLASTFITVWNRFAPKEKGWEITPDEECIYEFFKGGIHD
jgi:hypothetical protein